MAQSDKIKPLPGQAAGTVFYTMPFASPPNLKIKNSRFLIGRQNELGFTWIDRKKLAGNPELLTQVGGAFKPAEDYQDRPEIEEFTWEARGILEHAGTPTLKLFEQRGTISTHRGLETVVNFPFPYASPPHVEFSGTNRGFMNVTECTTIGFKCKNTGTDPGLGSGQVTWIAQGIKATMAPR